MNDIRKNHWEKVYQTKKPGEVSWYQLNPVGSLDLIALTGITPDQKVIDVGGGASVLVDRLLERRFQDITVLDISTKAIQHAKERLAGRAEEVTWVEADVTAFDPSHQFDLWHDRAVFHFLTDPDDRKKYVEVMKRSVKPGAHVIIATFAPEGPTKCSGLNVERYDSQKLSEELGDSFHLIKSLEETHITPWQAEQKFIYGCFEKVSIGLKSTIRCPHCGFEKEETMPTDSCQFFYKCTHCGVRLKPKEGDCCVFCSYGTVPCPSRQEKEGGCC